MAKVAETATRARVKAPCTGLWRAGQGTVCVVIRQALMLATRWRESLCVRRRQTEKQPVRELTALG